MASGGGFAFLENVVVGALAATFGAFLPLAILIVLVAELHGRIKQKRIVQAMVAGFPCGFIGLVAAIAIEFGLNWLSTRKPG